MKAVGVIFLLGLALIHVCLADSSTTDTKDEEPTALSDGVTFKDGYVFDEDDIFAKKADWLIKYSAEVMKECNTSECRNYTQCMRVDRDNICLSIRLFNSTNFEELEKPEDLKLHAILPSGYIFDTDETFFEKANSLLTYSLEVMEECRTKECQYYTYCTKVGYDIVCLTIRLNKYSDLLKDLALEEDADATEEDIDLDAGHIFDDDEIFAEKSDDLLAYSASIMSTCTTRRCRHYSFCTIVGYDILCLAVSLSSSDALKNNEELDTLPYLDDDDDDDEPNDVQELDNEDILDSEQEDNNELLEGKDSEEESEKESKESEKDEEEKEEKEEEKEEEGEKQKEDLAEEKEDTLLA